MICRKCGAQIPDDSLRCSNCGIKVNMVCPECKTLNMFGTKKCKNCGFELIKICQECGASNIFSAVKCRKCNTPLNNAILADDKQEIVTPISMKSSDTYRENINIASIEHISEINSAVKQKEEKELIEQNNISTSESAEEVTLQTSAEENSNLNNNIEYIDENLDETIEIEPIKEYKEAEDEYTKQEEYFAEDETDYKEEEELTDNTTFKVQGEIVNKVINKIKNSADKSIIALNGPEGCGKTAVISRITEILSNDNFIFLKGSCTPLSQITSFGFFQDAFLRLMGFPPYINNINSFIKDFKKSKFYQVFNFLDNNELNLFLNIFYPSLTDKFENILYNKQEIFLILEKIIKSFLVNSNIIIAIDNFELLDGASYDFIMYMLNKKSFNNRLKILAAYEEDKSIQSYFDITYIDEEIFETICINKFNNKELLEVTANTLGINPKEILPEDILKDLLEKSDGNALRFEQELAFLFDVNYISVDNNEIIINEENRPDTMPDTFEELIRLRINALTPSYKNCLFMSAIMGLRFSISILLTALSAPLKKADEITEFLTQNLYINRVDNFTCEFKSLTLWKLIYKEAQKDLLYKENAQRLYKVLKPLVISSNLQKLISCTDALSKNEAFLIWDNTAELTAKLGDTNLFVIAKKQCLKLLDEQTFENADEIRSTIYEQIGKLLYKKSPKEALTYLSNILDSELKSKNIKKVIDLAGYFIQSCYLSGNYFGAAEITDSIIANLNPDKIAPIDIALLKTRKLKALFNIGNCEQIINIAEEEIIPEIEAELSKEINDITYKNILTDALMLSSTILAKTYALQGNIEVYNQINNIRQFMEKNKYKNDYYTVQTDIIEALANSLNGFANNSNAILDKITVKYADKTLEPNLLAEWNLVKIINRISDEKDSDLKADLFELAAFTNNINEHFIKNIIKLILGYIIKSEGNINKALNIYNEEITYFAKEKEAIGAMLSWALIVDLDINTGDIEKALSTASKSLEIAQSAKINNYYFIITFQKLLAEIYLIKGDLTAVKMYLEKAIMLAKQHKLKYLLAQLYINYARYMQAFIKLNQNYEEEHIKITLDMCEKALQIAKELKNTKLSEKASRERSSFRTYCQLKSIEI